MIYLWIGTIVVVVGLPIYLRYRNDIHKAYERITTGSNMIHTDYGMIQYTEIGAVAPMLIVHGAGGGYDQGNYFAKLIGGNYRWIAPSRFGFLGSPVPEEASSALQADAYACLLDALAEVDGNYALILDDYHSVDGPEIGEILQFLIDKRPDVFHLVLITRIAPSLSLSRLRALDQLIEIDAADLRFRQVEMGEFLENCMNVHLSAAAVLAETHELPISQARVYLALGDASTALAVLEPLRQQVEAKGWVDEWLKIMILQAVAFHALGENEQAVQALGEALALAEPGGFIRIFVDEGEPMAYLLKESLNRGIAPNYIQRLLTAFSIDEPEQALAF